jgi:methionyl-tRNA formyltransferase
MGGPGEIIGELEGGLEIAAGQGSLIVTRAQFEADEEGDAGAVLGAGQSRPRALL